MPFVQISNGGVQFFLISCKHFLKEKDKVINPLTPTQAWGLSDFQWGNGDCPGLLGCRRDGDWAVWICGWPLRWQKKRQQAAAVAST